MPKMPLTSGRTPLHGSLKFDSVFDIEMVMILPEGKFFDRNAPHARFHLEALVKSRER